MNDLISRNTLKQEIKSLQITVTGLRAGKGVLRDFANEYKESVLRIIDEQPTAYNVESVVQQIKELKEYCNNTNCDDCKHKGRWSE